MARKEKSPDNNSLLYLCPPGCEHSRLVVRDDSVGAKYPLMAFRCMIWHMGTYTSPFAVIGATSPFAIKNQLMARN